MVYRNVSAPWDMNAICVWTVSGRINGNIWDLECSYLIQDEMHTRIVLKGQTAYLNVVGVWYLESLRMKLTIYHYLEGVSYILWKLRYNTVTNIHIYIYVRMSAHCWFRAMLIPPFLAPPVDFSKPINRKPINASKMDPFIAVAILTFPQRWILWCHYISIYL